MRVSKDCIEFDRFCGVPIRLHISVFFGNFIFAFTPMLAFPFHKGIVVFALLFFAFPVCVLLHELGHALMARAIGARIMRIDMNLNGGYIWVDNFSNSAVPKILFFISGPLVNFLIAGLSYIIVSELPPAYNTFDDAYISLIRNKSYLEAGVASIFWCWLGLGNLFLGVLNLLPATGLDGGQILEAILSPWTGNVVARRLVAAMGVVIAILQVPIAFGLILSGILFPMAISLKDNFHTCRSARLQSVRE